jgi:hypothetical protein
MKLTAPDITRCFPIPDIKSSPIHIPDQINQTQVQEEAIIISKRSKEMIPSVESMDHNVKDLSMVQLRAINII